MEYQESRGHTTPESTKTPMEQDSNGAVEYQDSREHNARGCGCDKRAVKVKVKVWVQVEV